MYKEIEVGDITVPMLANGATPLRYKLLFKKDLIREFQAAQGDYSKVLDSVPELAYVMAKQAEAHEGKTDLALLNQDDYLQWLEQFEAMGLPMTSEAIVNLYLGNMETSSDPKKKVRGKVNEN